MKIIPVITEKSIEEAKKGNYTFYFKVNFTKDQIRVVIERIFKVKVTKVRTMNYKGQVKKTYTGRKKVVKPKKKVIVTLAQKDKIDLFEEKTK